MRVCMQVLDIVATAASFFCWYYVRICCMMHTILNNGAHNASVRLLVQSSMLPSARAWMCYSTHERVLQHMPYHV